MGADAIEIRRARRDDATAMAETHIAAWLTTYPGLLPDDVIARRTDRATRIALWEQRLRTPDASIAVAVDGETVAAVACATPFPLPLPYGRVPIEGFDAYLDALYARASYRGHGLGRRLLRWIADDLGEAGRTSLAFHVHAANPARAFYERMGARFVRDEPPEEPGATWHTCVYGWDDTSVLRG